MSQPFELLRGAESLFERILQDLAAARRRVWLETYLLHEDEATRRLLSGLGEAAQRGLDVRLLVDGFGGGTDAERMRPWMSGMGIRLRVFRPSPSPWSPRAWRRLHRKLVLIDDELLYIGGINLLSDWEDPNHGRLAAPRLDYAVRCRSASVQAQAAMVMAKTWWRVGWRGHGQARELRQRWQEMRRDLALARARRTVESRQKQAQARLVFRDDLRHPRAIEREIERLLQAARTEVCLAMAYFVPTGRLRRILRQAVRRGVRVSVLLQGRTEYWWARWAEQLMVEELLSDGIEVWEYRASFLHAKVLVADDRATVGSSNWDPFSLWLAQEANLVLHDAAFARALREDLQRQMSPGVSNPRQAPSRVRGLMSAPMRLLQRMALGFVLTLLRAVR